MPGLGFRQRVADLSLEVCSRASRAHGASDPEVGEDADGGE